jgi:ATP-binding cassette subfamily B protein
MTVAENVLMRSPESKEDYKKVEDSLKRAGVYEKVCRLPHGMDTVLTKEFAEDGAVLSGGELQKIAVARAFAKEYKIAIFDEPSSALDPVAEYQLYENILQECADKTVVFISHRLSTAVLADRIYLFENGRIIEAGNHEMLMQRNDKYADMFRKQAENYVGGMEYAQ